ncbi:MAG: hypothetical protein QHI38_00020 [Armatimonadota bacterium]|nr:hypothetical protein [Armatimonadota bacterium]
MQCLDDKQLEEYISARLDSASLMVVDAHLRACENCRNRLQSLRLTGQALSSLAAQVACLWDCPDYEVLSALLDGTLDKTEANRVRSHINACYLCYRDVQRMQELRAQAQLREPITVEPKKRAQGIQPRFAWWKVLAAVGAATAVLAALLVSYHPFSKPGVNPEVVARRSETQKAPNEPTVRSIVPHAQKKTDAQIEAPSSSRDEAVVRRVALLRDGTYRLISVSGRYVLVSGGRETIRTPLEARIARLISEKIRTGKIKPAPTVRVALNRMRLRAPSEFVPEPTAPRLLRPLGITVIEDQPVFTWSRVDLAESYRLVITDQNGSLVYQAVTTGTQLRLDRPLQRGRIYLWRVGAKFGESDNWSNSAAGVFRVLSSEEYSLITSVKRAMPGSHLALAVVYESLGLHDEAAREYEVVRAQNAGSVLARRLVVK